MASNGDGPENSEYAAFAQRVIRGFGRRVGEGDIDALPDLLALRDLLDAVTGDAVAALRAEPNQYSWRQIGDRLGVKRQAAIQRWGHLDAPGARKRGGQPSALR